MDQQNDFSSRWCKGDKIGVGGQATTFATTAKEDSKVIGALKILSRQDDPERRARMHRESSALNTLDHPLIPKVLDTNSQFFKDLKVKLYIVTDFIPGGTLADNIKQKPAFGTIVQTVMEIAKVIQYCHRRGIVHRDLKPDNIILKEKDWLQPVVIDFGISFNNEEQDSDKLTPSEQQLGNRFLILPEQKVGSSSKRDMRSDITCCVGLLFYLLVESMPTNLMDEQNRKPHQRERERELIRQLPTEYQDKLNRLFDVGFNQHIDQRIQTAESLLKILTEIMEVPKHKEEDALAKAKSVMSTVDYTAARNNRAILVKVHELIVRAVVRTVATLGSDFESIQSGGEFDIPASTYRNTYGVQNVIANELRSMPTFVGYITGSELVVTATQNEIVVELLREASASNIEWTSYESTFVDYYLTNLHVVE